ncbi:MAG TPA: STAS domain-containing protein [Devosiaceae bacterium]|jgi:anti-anti-sigma regulatory factor
MSAANSARVMLPASLDLDALENVRDSFIEAFDMGPVTVSGAEVERIATNGLMLLLSAAETARRNGSGFEIVEAAGPMLAAIDRLGLGDAFTGMLKG